MSTPASKRRMLVGLLGANIQGSISPALFAAAFAAAGIDGYYHLLDADGLRERRLPLLLGAIKAAGFAGANVTFPFKQEILPLLDAIDASAAEVGAVNTVAIAPDGRTTGYNFDRAGWRNSFAATFGADGAKAKTVVQIGAGGAGRAVAFALRDLGASPIRIFDRDGQRARSLCADLRCGEVLDTPEPAAASAAGIVNATPIGMIGHDGLPMTPDVVRPGQYVADVIYTPLETEFVKAAKARGARTMGGAGMCVHQAVDAFRHFTGKTPEIARLKRTFEAAAARRSEGGLA